MSKLATALRAQVIVHGELATYLVSLSHSDLQRLYSFSFYFTCVHVIPPWPDRHVMLYRLVCRHGPLDVFLSLTRTLLELYFNGTRQSNLAAFQGCALSSRLL